MGVTITNNPENGSLENGAYKKKNFPALLEREIIKATLERM